MMNNEPTPKIFTTQKEIDALRFGGDVDCRNVTFKCHADFSGKVFKGKVDFRGAVFEDGASFEKAVFQTHGQDVLFTEAVFLPSENDVIFENAKFGVTYDREFGEWEIWFEKEEKGFYLRRSKKREKDGNSQAEWEYLGQFSDVKVLKELVKSKGMQDFCDEIVQLFELFQNNPGNVSFQGSRFGDMDITGFADEEFQAVIDKESKRLKEKFCSEQDEERLKGFKKFFGNSGEAVKKPDEKLKSTLIGILTRYLNKQYIETRRVDDHSQQVDFEGTEFNNNGSVDFRSTVFCNNKEVNFRSAAFCNNKEVNFRSAVFCNSSNIDFEFASFSNRSHIDFGSASFSNHWRIDFNSASFRNDGHVDFSLASFRNGSSVEFNSATFGNTWYVNFKSASFRNGSSVEFNSATFSNGEKVNFNSSSFSNDGHVDFQSSSFSNDGHVDFQSSSFSNDGHVGFQSSSFSNVGDVGFDWACFANGGSVDFKSSTFSNGEKVNFNSSSFSNDEHVDFQSSSFSNDGHVDFQSSNFGNGGTVDFESVRFRNGESLCFQQMIWANSGELSWNQVEFKDTASVKFDECLFLSGDAISFNEARFPKDGSLMFQRCYFARTAKIDFTKTFFRHTTFEGGKINWLKGKGECERTFSALLKERLKKKFNDLPQEAKDRIENLDMEVPEFSYVFEKAKDKGVEVLWEDLTTESAKNITFRMTNLSGSVFDGVTLSHIQLNAPKWLKEKGRNVLAEERQLRENSGEISIDQLRNIEDQYTQLKNNLERQGNYLHAGDFHYGEQEFRREILKLESKNLKGFKAKCGHFFSRTLSWFYKRLSGYGEQPGRAVRVFLGLFVALWLGVSCLDGRKGVFRPFVEVSTPFSWAKRNLSQPWPPTPPSKEISSVDPPSNWKPYYWFLIPGQLFLFGIQLPLTILATRRRFKR
jgi:hypothetical protein